MIDITSQVNKKTKQHRKYLYLNSKKRYKKYKQTKKKFQRKTVKRKDQQNNKNTE